ncbi:MAG: hypothetical protein ACRD2K_05385 [Terriglobales bacterium]
MKLRLYKPPDVSADFFTYASGLDRDRLLELRLTRLNARANLRKRIAELAGDYAGTLAEVRLCNWLLRNGEPAVSAADRDFLQACGIAAVRFPRRRTSGQPHRDHPRGAHAPRQKAGSHRAAQADARTR